MKSEKSKMDDLIVILIRMSAKQSARCRLMAMQLESQNSQPSFNWRERIYSC